MKAIVTVLGKDSVGIVARISAILAKEQVNIIDISQTILDGNFTMVMVVETSQMGQSFQAVQAELATVGETLGVQISMQREEIFQAMHTL